MAVILTGSVLYTCKVKIAVDAAGENSPITIAAAVASDANGHRLQGVTGNPGSVNVVVTQSATVTRTATTTPTPTPCAGDCGSDDKVTIEELIRGVTIALGDAHLSECRSFDTSGDGQVTVDELIAAVSNALYGCGVFTPTPFPTRTPTPSATRTRTSTPTITATPRRVHVDVGSGRGMPGGTAVVTVSLDPSGSGVAGTANEITLSTYVLDLNPGDCRVASTTGKSLVASVVSEFSGRKTLRFFLQSSENRNLIPGGPLYTCTFHIKASSLPGAYALTNGNILAFAPDGSEVGDVVGGDGILTVSLVP